MKEVHTRTVKTEEGYDFSRHLFGEMPRLYITTWAVDPIDNQLLRGVGEWMNVTSEIFSPEERKELKIKLAAEKEARERRKALREKEKQAEEDWRWIKGVSMALLIGALAFFFLGCGSDMETYVERTEMAVLENCNMSDARRWFRVRNRESVRTGISDKAYLTKYAIHRSKDTPCIAELADD